jgi:hypothetical protein
MVRVTFGRLKGGQTRLVPVVKKVDPERARVRRIAAQLREVYKKYKAGLLSVDELTPEQKRLLIKYYGVK